MAKSVKEILSEQMPNYRVVQSAASDAAPRTPARRTSRSIKALRKKYVDLEPGSESDSATNSCEEVAEDDDVQIVNVEPVDADSADGPGPLSVVISLKQGKIIGQQG